jgi:D-xylose transport system permease protein
MNAPAQSPSAAAAPGATSARGFPRELSMLLALLLIGAFFSFEQPAFLSPRNLSLLLIELSVTAILALGMLVVLLPSQIDLSAGSGVGLTGAIAAVLIFDARWPAPLGLLAAAAIAVVLWALMGSAIIRERIPAFIITLGGLLVFKGAHWLVIRGQTIPVVEGGKTNLYSLLTTYYLSPTAGYALYALVVAGIVIGKLRGRSRRQSFGFSVDDRETTFLKLFVAAQLLLLLVVVTNQYRGIPLAALILGGIALVVQVLTQHTPFGRYLYAIGSNEEAALLSGVPIQRVVVTAYALMGLIVALAGFMQTAYAGTSTTTVGTLMELDAIAACVIGGTSLRGGRGTVLGVLFGSLIMATLLNGMTLMAVAPEIKPIARGVVLALAVWMDVRLAKK